MGLLYDYHVMLTLRFVKVTRGYVKKAGLITLPLFNSYTKATQYLMLFSSTKNLLVNIANPNFIHHL